jgi:hypothetical protein
MHSVLSVANAHLFYASSRSHNITIPSYDRKPHAANRDIPGNHLEFAELLNSLASSGQHTEDVESDL